MPHRGSAVVISSLLLAAILAAIVLVQHASAYFFLFDDYALVGQASTVPIEQILRLPLFGFYRPAAFLLTRLEFWLSGGWHPAAFAAVSLGTHVLNAALAGLLAHRLRPVLAFSLATAGLFLLSPWAGEAFFWGSARFDLLATTGTLLALWLAEHASDPTASRRRRIVSGAGALLGCAVALLSKEASVVLPLLFVAMAMMGQGDDWRARLRPRVVMLVLSGAMICAYLAYRSTLLPAFGGVYGRFGDLLLHADLLRHVSSYAMSLVLLPAPAGWSLGRVLFEFAGKWPFLVMALPALVGLTVKGARRHVFACAGGFLVALAPVAWIGMVPAQTASGRLLYLPGLFFVLLLARGMEEAWRLAPWLPTSRRVVCWGTIVGVPLVYFCGSLHHQQRMWAQASDLAHRAISQFAPLVGTTQPVFLPNLPFWFTEGPFVIKSYAFGYYYAPRPVPPVRAMASVLTFEPGVDGSRPGVRELRRVPEPGGLPVDAPSNGERTLNFVLPVLPAPGATPAP